MALPELRSGTFDARVCSNYWMLVYDTLRHDECQLALSGFIFDKFSLLNDITQGRKRSVDASAAECAVE